MKDRLSSLDALRGFDMFMIMGMSGVVFALCSALGWGGDCWLAEQFRHVEWNGFHFEDTIFPLFLFLAGVSWPFSCAKQVEKGRTTGQIVRKCVRRAVVLFVLGLVYGGLLKGQLRLGSVLGRIGVAWMVGALLYLRLRPRALLAVALALPVVYWMVIYFVPAPDAATALAAVPEKMRDVVASCGTGPYSIVGNLSGWVERTFLPGEFRPYGIFDNQSVLGYVPATSTALLGMLTGDFVRRTRRTLSDGRRLAALVGAAAALVALGLLIAFGFGEMSMPINKKLWSASFTFVVGGYSVAMFALFHWIVDVLGFEKWTLPLRVVGMNSITIYVAQAFVPFGVVAERVFGGVASLLAPSWGRVLMAVAYVAVCWLALYFLYRKNVFLRV